MATRGLNFRWYDGFFLSMLVISVIIVAANWKKYDRCTHPLHIWLVVDYLTIFMFRLLMFVDNGLSAGMGLDFGWQQRHARFCGRIFVLSILSLLFYPFLWGWTVIGSLWFTKGKNCLPVEGQEWGFLLWFISSYTGLVCVALFFLGKWLARRRALRGQQGIPVSEFRVLVDMIRVPDWAFEAARLEIRGMGQDTYYPGLHLTPAQREALEALISDLPKFTIKAVPTDCSECPICLEEFIVGDEVRGLPCAHNFHTECIDQWLRLNIRCPRCRCSVFPNLDFSALSNLRPESEREQSSSTVLSATRHVTAQTRNRSYQLSVVQIVQSVNGRSGNEVAGNGRPPLTIPEPEHIIDVPHLIRDSDI